MLVANRGEIVVRVCRTLRDLGTRSVAIYAPDDADAPHTRSADLAVPVAGYLDAPSIVAAARSARADAVHPGYGFLSEDPSFARAVVAAGLVWIGPPADAIETMGDKIRAKETVARAGVPVVPGAGRAGMDDEALVAAALELGLPVLLKPAAGGGGKGMRRVAAEEDLPASIAAARREAQGAFGDATLLVERWVDRPRHVEVQIFADTFGNVVSLGERECSLQRRHQKIVEESPSPLLDDATRSAMSQSAVDAARSCGYVGAGTVEFIVSGERPGEYFFMEMNTRLQVEHPVTEAVTDVDLVEWQLRVAAGEPIPLSQDEISRRGHAVEARLYAEDPLRGFLPASGTVALLSEPTDHPHVRVDSGLAIGAVVGTRYDPMLAKVIAWGATRGEAIDRLRGALEDTAVLGVTTNVGYLARLLAHPDVAAGHLDTGLVDRTLDELGAPPEGRSRDAALVAACRVASGLEPRGAVVDPWEVPDGWAVGGPRAWTVSLRHGGLPLVVEVHGRVREGAVMRVDAGPAVEVQAPDGGRAGGEPTPVTDPRVTIGGSTAPWKTAVVGDDVWVCRLGDAWRFTVDRGGARGCSWRRGPRDQPHARCSGRRPRPSRRQGACGSAALGGGSHEDGACGRGSRERGGDGIARPGGPVHRSRRAAGEGGPRRGGRNRRRRRQRGSRPGEPPRGGVGPMSGRGRPNRFGVHPRADLPSRVRIWEVGPRDGLQNEPSVVPAAVKAELVRRLVDAGLGTVETSSFVNPAWVPQLADAEEVFALLAPLRTSQPEVRLPALVPNVAGLERARSSGVHDICVFASATETFAEKNLNRSRDEALEMFAPVVSEAKRAAMGVRAYVSMCFGDPWEGAVAEGDVVAVCERLLEMGADELSLGDTIGVATTGQVVDLLGALARAGIPSGRLAVHFHDTYGQALANTMTAISCGVTTVDASAGGIGGCPFAKSATGNLATEDLCWALAGVGVETGVDLDRLVETSAWMSAQLGRPSPSKVVQALGTFGRDSKGLELDGGS